MIQDPSGLMLKYDTFDQVEGTKLSNILLYNSYISSDIDTCPSKALINN